MPYLYTRMSIYCHLSMRMIIASVSSYLVIRMRRFWKIIEKKIENRINIDLAIIASQSSERRFMTHMQSGDVSNVYTWMMLLPDVLDYSNTPC